ncbi:MAG: amino acid adenylation domain-containing protein, partial [Acidobacteriota bacterium]|nr:amino acid adenylation domain-containing protein [Acidobacteriota bacterium]
VDEADAALECSFEYNTDLFDGETIARMAANFETLLEAIVCNPDLRLAEIPLLSESERRLHEEWNATSQPYTPRCVHEMFEDRVERTPGATALVFGRERLTYDQLNRRANQLAHRLRQQHGAGPEVLIGVCMERSFEMVVSLLAILKAGAAYVPIDPAYPSERVRFMLEDSRVAVLLTQERLAGRLPSTDAFVLRVDAEGEGLAAEDSNNPVSEAAPDNLAYVIYTSGSTGRPKGVCVTHSNVTRLLASTQHWFNFNSQDVWTLFHSFAFDFSVWEMWGALAYGGRLVVVPYLTSRAPEQFYDLLLTEGVTVLNQTPSAFRQLLSEDEARASRRSSASEGLKLRYVIFGGEALEPAGLRTWFERHGDERPRLVNMYGITETTVHVTYRPLTRADVEGGSRSPIGVAIPDLRLYVLDSHAQFVPLGVPGELYVGGAGLARGYLGRPELTAERFVPDPFCGLEGARLYKTGDLVRRLARGEIEYIGRLDQQVKLRGFRIELGEIESALSLQASVKEALVLVREDEPGDRRLVAYVLAQAGESIEPAHLRSALREHLPDYMIPQSFVALDGWPLTPNGKVDREALPAPPRPREFKPEMETGLTPREGVLLGIWRDVLRLDAVGVHDNFFELGGDSILSIQVVARASQAGLRITPKQFFQNQTIAELARVAAEKADRPQAPDATGPAPLTPIQHWFFEQELEEAHHFNQSALLEVPSDTDPELLAQAVGHVYRHHDGLRLRFSRDGNSWAQQVSEADAGAVFSFEDLSGHSKEERAVRMARIVSAVERSLDIENGPLMRVCLFRLGEDETARLWIVIHHLAVDGVSWRILLEDLYNVYRQLSCREEVRLPPKTTSFTEWARRLAEHARSAEGKAEAGFWLEPLSLHPKPIPVDRPATKQANRVVDAEAVVVSLGEAETLSLLQEVPQAYNTRINDLLLTALALAFQQAGGGDSLLLDFESHGRREFEDEIDLSRTVGWFTTISPVLVQVEPDAPLGQTLKSVKEQLRRIPEDGFGYMLHKYLSPDAELRSLLRASPRPEIVFNYLGQTDLVLPQSSGWGPAPEEVGAERAPSVVRSHLLEVVASVAGGQLQVNWIYSKNIHDRETVERLARGFAEALRALIRHCCAPASRGFTPSDFPQANLGQKDLDKLAQLITERDPSVAKDSVADVYELSPMQRGLIFHSLFDLESPAYFEQLSCTIEGELDAGALFSAWERVVERHAALRTGFFWHDLAHPVQVVFRSVELPWEFYDWRSQPGAERQQAFDAFLARDRARGLPLDQAPLFRCTLIREGETTHRFCWSHHHVLLDGWSAAILMEEVFDAYDASLKGTKLPPSPPPQPYRRYIEWLQAQDNAEAEAYWRKVLKGFSAPTPLPEDASRRAPNADGHEQAEASLLLDEEFTEQIGLKAKTLRVTINSLISGAWALLLSRYSGEREVVFGVTVAGRPPLLEGIESMVGLFINTLPVRFRLKPEASLASWLSDIHRSQADLDQYAYSSLIDIQKWSDIPAGTPLFNTLLVFENYPMDRSFDRQPGGLRTSDVRAFDQTNYPLTLTVVPGQRMLVRLTYDSEGFERATAERMLDHLCTLLEAFTHDPSRPLSDLPLLTDAERAQLLTNFNLTEVAFDPSHSFIRRFEAQAASSPSRTAVTCS